MSNHQNPPQSEYSNLMFHPYNVMLFLVLMAVSALFLALSAAFVYTRIDKGVGALDVPWLFGVSTIVLLLSSWTMWRAKKSYIADNTAGYQQSLTFTIVLTGVFLLLQVFAWLQLFQNNIFPETDNSAGYLYVLSLLHFAHVIAGIPFLFFFRRAAKRHMKDPVTVLVYFSDPEKRLRLRLLSIYWHFLDALWIFLVLFLLVNQLIR